jgi:outer membrane protein assembly factor BamA
LRSTAKVGNLIEDPLMRYLPILLLSLSTLSLAQVQSRSEEMERARQEKRTQLEPDSPGKWEQRLIIFKDRKLLERLSAGIAGVRLKLGGMPTGGGFALGPDYFRDDLARGNLFLNASAQASANHWTRLQFHFAAPAFASNRLFWRIYGIRQDYNSLQYYGPGPDSVERGRSNYRLEDSGFDTVFGVKPVKWFSVGASSGYQFINTGPGLNSDVVSTEKQFPARLVPGLDRQTNFFRWGTFAQVDWRDSQLGPRAGGNYSIRYDDYNDQKLGRHNFQRLDVDLHHYIPFFNKRRVIALRAQSILTFKNPGNTVPFYHQAVLGGSDQLRGYRPYRFNDDNMLALNAEYRWETFSGLDMAVFADAGKVFPRRSQLNFHDLESAVGFGFRFNVRNATFLRLDVGFSHEGYRIWVKFNDLFTQRPFGVSTAPHLF